MLENPKVYLFDFWLTLGTSLSEDPIATFYRQLGFEGQPPDAFMTACLTGTRVIKSLSELLC